MAENTKIESLPKEQEITEKFIPNPPPPPSKKPLKFSNPLYSKPFRYILTVALLILIFGTSGLIAYWSGRAIQRPFSSQPLPISTPSPVPSPTPFPTPALTADWKVFSSSEAAVSFKYPSSVKIIDSFEAPNNELSISVLIEEVNKIEASNLGYDPDTALQDIESLKKGEYGNSVDFDLEDSREVIRLGKFNAKSFVVLGRFDTCDIAFERKFILYTEAHRIIFTLFGPETTIKQESPEYFIKGGCADDELCCWDYQNNAQEYFFNKLESGQAAPTAQRWYDTFDQIISTFEFLD